MNNSTTRPGKRLRGYEIKALTTDYRCIRPLAHCFLADIPFSEWEEVCKRTDLISATLIRSGRVLFTHSHVRVAAELAPLNGNRGFQLMR